MTSNETLPNAPVPDAADSGRRLPSWIRVRVGASDHRGRTRAILAGLRLHTVCEEADCPNLAECWGRGTATFMILGERCTRACGFCAVDTRRPLPPEADEPDRVADAVAEMGLRHVVVTSVARDDLDDEGAGHFAAVIRAVRDRSPETVIEVLVPDFNGREPLIDLVVDARPDVFNHNIETVRRLERPVRSRATYDRSLGVLRYVGGRGTDIVTKSGIMLGLGELDDEVDEALRDLRKAGCEVVTIGQYLRPTPKHLPVERWVPPAEFERWGRRATELGFIHAASGPLVRSSYHADDFHPRTGAAKVADRA